MPLLQRARGVFKLVTEIGNIDDVKALWNTIEGMAFEIGDVEVEKRPFLKFRLDDRRLKKL